MTHANGNALAFEDDRDYADPEIVKAAILALRAADEEQAGGIGALLAGIERIEKAQREALTLTRLCAIQIDETNVARRGDKRITDAQLRKLATQVADLEARPSGLPASEIEKRAKLESNHEHFAAELDELKEEIDETKKQNIEKLVESAQRKTAEAEALKEQLRAAGLADKTVVRERWNRREAALLSLLAAVILAAVTTYLGTRTPAPMQPQPTQQQQQGPHSP